MHFEICNLLSERVFIVAEKTAKQNNDIHGQSFVDLKMAPAAGSMVTLGTVMRYVSGCMTRERARLAEVITGGEWLHPELQSDPRVQESLKRLAKAVDPRDLKSDQVVFQWRPAATTYESGLAPH